MAVTERAGKAEDFSNGFVFQSRVVSKSGQLYRNGKKNAQFVLIVEHLQRFTDQPRGRFRAGRPGTPAGAGNNHPAGVAVHVALPLKRLQAALRGQITLYRHIETACLKKLRQAISKC